MAKGPRPLRSDRQVGIRQASQDWSTTYFSQTHILVIIVTTMMTDRFFDLTVWKSLLSILHVLIH